MRVLHLGCGRTKTDDLALPDGTTVVTLDADPNLNPDIICTLGLDRIPLPDDSIDVAVAMHVLEHIGQQGQTDAWFFFWEELYRVLRKNGQLHFESPLYSSVWCWADPQHCRALSPTAFLFFDQDSYRIKNSRITPYRIKCDFRPTENFIVRPDTNPGIAAKEEFSHFSGILRAQKPFNPWWED